MRKRYIKNFSSTILLYVIMYVPIRNEYVNTVVLLGVASKLWVQ
jgi:hypothetical protein